MNYFLTKGGYLSVAILSILTVGSVFAQSISACSDGLDNDGDGYTDLQDPGCLYDASGTSEADAGINTVTQNAENLVIIGGSAADRISIGASNSGLRVRVNGVYTYHSGVSTVYVYGLGGADYITSSSTVDAVFVGGAGDDYLSGYTGKTVFDGGEGNDRILANTGENTVYGGEGNDRIYGRGGKGIFHGGDGNDLISAGGGYNIVIGGNGEDYIRGGRGNDILIGGTTTYDANLSALTPTLNHWASGGDVSTLIDDIQHGRNVASLNHSNTVLDDAKKDTVMCYIGGDVAFSFPLDVVRYASYYCDKVITEPVEPENEEGTLLIENISSDERHQVLAGAESDELLAVSLTAVDGDVAITELDFESNLDDINRLLLTIEGEQHPFAHATRGACGSLSNTYCMRIPEEQALQIASGETVKISVTAQVYNDEQSDITSGEQFTVSLGNAEGPVHETVLAKVSTVQNANPDADGTNVPVGQQYPIGQFAITALQNQNTKNGVNDVEIDAFVFHVEYENVAFDRNAFRLYNKQDQTRTADCSVESEQAATLFVSCPHLRDTGVNVEIDDGDTQTFVLAADITDNQVNGSQPSRVQVSLKELDTPWRAVLWYDADTFTSVAHNWFEVDQADVYSTEYALEAAPEPAAELFVTQQALASSDVAVENQNDLPLLRFEATASEGEDVLISKAVFEAQAGSLNNGQNYALWVDTDGNGEPDTILEDDVFAQSSQVRFTNLIGGGFIVPAQETVIFEVRTDIASNLTDNELQLRFATSDATYITAEENDNGTVLEGIETNGECAATCQVHVTTVEDGATLWQLVSQGSLYVTEDSFPVRNRQLLGGTLSDTVLRVEMHAENEPIDVTDLQITNVLADGVSSIDRLELFRVGESAPFALATIGGCGSDPVPSVGRTYCANTEAQQFVLAENSDLDVLIRVRMRSDVQGGVSGEPMQFALLSKEAVRARGYDSTNNLLVNDEDSADEGEVFIGTSVAGAHQDIVGTEHVSVLSKIVSITNANPDANGTSVPTGISAIGQFKVTAAAHNNSNDGLNDVVLNHIIYTLTGENVLVDASSLRMYNKFDQTRTHACTLLNADGTLSGSAATVVSGSMYVQCDDLTAGSVRTEISEGEDETFVLEADILNPNTQAFSGENSFLQVQLDAFADPALNGTFGALESHVEWIDTDFATVSPFQWIEYPETTVRSTLYQS